MGDPGNPPRGPVAFCVALVARAAGLVLIATALLTAASVSLRWLTSQPIPGDFELVSIGSGIAVLGSLAYGTLVRTNILVDTFTTGLPRRARDALDAFWMLVWLVVALALAERMARGALETWRSGTTTMVLALPTWWVVGLGALGFALTAAAAGLWLRRLLRGQG
jgi:TRAP-type C4-dicarboxylate transport system permease small subunit